MAGRLLAARRGVGGFGEHRQHEVERGHAHAHAHHNVAVVRSKPVVLRLQRPADADLSRLVAGARDDEWRAALTVQDLEAVVDLAAQEDVPEPLFQRLLVQAGVAPGDRLLVAPLGAEGRTFRLGDLRHGLFRSEWRGRPRPSPPPSPPRSTSGGGGCCARAPTHRPGRAASAQVRR